MTSRWTPLAAHLRAATPRREPDSQAVATQALVGLLIGVVAALALWGWLG